MEDYTLYEHQVCQYYQNKTRAPTWHWSNAPVEHLVNSGWALNAKLLRLLRLEDGKTPQEYGLDGIAHNLNGSYTGIQAKMRKNVKASDLGTFILACDRIAYRNSKSSGHLCYTGTLDKHLRDEIATGMHTSRSRSFERLPYVKQPGYDTDVAVEKPAQHTPYPIQVEAGRALDAGWDGLTILHMPCGTGKTFTCLSHVSRMQYNCVVVLSPLRVHAKQLMRMKMLRLPDYEGLLVDSDSGGLRDADEIRKALAKGMCFISATYRSADVLLECFAQDPGNALLVVDEAHKLSREENAVELTRRFSRVMLMSATPPAAIDGYDDISVVYSLSMRDAIQQGYITDYKVVLPSVALKDTNELVGLVGLDEYYRPRTQFMMSCMVLFGLRRCIAYLPSVEACERFMETCRRVAKEYHGFGFWGESITNQTSGRVRDRLLREFQEGDEQEIRVLASVRILDEGVDVIRCDSVFFTEVPQAKCSDDGLRCAVQRLCRANRKDAKNPNKVAHALVWADENNQTPNFLGLLKEMDPEFGSHVRRVCRAYDAYDSSRENDAKETEELGKYITGCKVYDRQAVVEQKIRILETYYRHARPMQKKKEYKLENGEIVTVDMGSFWGKIKDNWIEGEKPHTTLIADHKARVKALGWFQAVIDKLEQVRTTKAASYQPTVEDKVRILEMHYRHERPNRRKKDYVLENGETITTDMEMFWNNIKNNWTEGKRPTTTLTVDQKSRVEALGWFQAVIDKLEQDRKSKAASYQPTVEDKVRILEMHYKHERPKEKKKDYVLEKGETVTVDMGSFWDSIKNNWTEDKKPITTLTLDQKARVKALDWFMSAIDKLEQVRTTKAASYQPTVEDKVLILETCYRHDRPIMRKKEYKLENGETVVTDMVSFWMSITGNWTEGRKTTLTVDQMARVKALDWFLSAIDKLEQARKAKGASYQPTVEDKVRILEMHYREAKPMQKKEKEYTLENGETVTVDMGQFWGQIKNNWTDGKKPGTTLTADHKARVKAIGWFQAAIDTLEQVRTTKAASYQPTVEDKVRILETYYRHVKPKNKKEEYKLENGETVTVDMGMFWDKIKNNWTEGEKPHTKMSADHKTRVKALGWFQAAIDKRKAKRGILK
jgi:superfamily II DNA or RNA helicase